MLTLLVGAALMAARPLADVLGLAVNIRDQGRQLLLEEHIIMRAAEAALIAEFIERNATGRTGPLIELRQLLGRLAKLQLLRQHAGQRGRDRRASRLALRQIRLRTGLTKVDLLRLTSRQLCNVKRRRLFALLTFHRARSFSRRVYAACPRGFLEVNPRSASDERSKS